MWISILISLGNRTPCQFCSFKPVCQFDQSFENNQYRNITQAGPDEMMAKMREGGMKVEN